MSTTTDTSTNTRTSTHEQRATMLRLSRDFLLNFYEVLDLTRKTATANDIKKSYKKLSLLTHSDKNDQTI